ncbi:hypothetical protein ACFL2I_00870 [Candidatus Omnitrophota bacterium]
MKIVPLTKDQYTAWDKFCLASEQAWFWHTAQCLEYSLNYKPELNSRSLSFMVCEHNDILGICPLVLEQLPSGNKRIKEFFNSGCGGHQAVPALKNGLSRERKEKILKMIFGEVDRLALEAGVKRASFRFSPLARELKDDQPVYNYLMKFGFLDSSLNTQIINLDLAEEKLMQNMRKGHKSDIKRGARDYIVEVYDKDNIKKMIFERYRLLHHKAAGRITRPLVTFEMMYQWIVEGKGILCAAKQAKPNSDYIGFAFIIIYKQGAYYGSYSDDPEVKVEVPLAHIIQWRTINWLKQRQIKRYELGTQQFGPQFYDYPSKKDLNIALFKRGFGGQTEFYFRGEKFYDKEYMQSVFEKRTSSLLNLAESLS